MLKRDTVQKDTVVSWRVLWLWLKSYWLWCIVGYREANRPCRGSPGPAPLAARGRVSTAPYRTIVLCLSPLTKNRIPGLYTPDCSKLKAKRFTWQRISHLIEKKYALKGGWFFITKHFLDQVLNDQNPHTCSNVQEISLLISNFTRFKYAAIFNWKPHSEHLWVFHWKWQHE